MLKHLNEEAPIQGLTKEQLTSHLLEDRRFIYEGFDIESMAFQSSLLLTLLGFTHLHDTAISKTTLVCAVCKVLEMGDLSVEMAVQTVQTRVVLLMVGWVEVPGMDLLAKCDHEIKGVLALCTAAVTVFLSSPTFLVTFTTLTFPSTAQPVYLFPFSLV